MTSNDELNDNDYGKGVFNLGSIMYSYVFFLFRVNIIWDDLFHENVMNNLDSIAQVRYLSFFTYTGVHVLN